MELKNAEDVINEYREQNDIGGHLFERDTQQLMLEYAHYILDVVLDKKDDELNQLDNVRTLIGRKYGLGYTEALGHYKDSILKIKNELK